MSEPSQPMTDTSTPEGARTRIADLMSDKSFGARFLSGDKGAQAELDALNRTVLGEQPQAAPASEAEAAKAKLGALKSDPEWSRRYLEGAGPERREFDSLVKAAAEGEGGEKTETPQHIEPGVPKSPSGYRFAERIPEGSEKLADSYRTAAHHAGLTQGEFEAINADALRSVQSNAGRTEAEIVTQLDADLHQIWGGKYDQMTVLVERYIEEYERGNPGTLAMLNERGLAYNKSLIVFLGHKAIARYGLPK